MDTQVEPGEKRSFLCQIETFFGTKEYAKHGRCVRLIGIESQKYGTLMNGQSEGVTTFILELDFWAFFMNEFEVSNWHEVANRIGRIEELETSLKGDRQWFRVDCEVVSQSAEYFYRTFSADEPVYVHVEHPFKVDIGDLDGSGPASTGRLAMLTQLSVQQNPGSHVERQPDFPPTGGEYAFHALHVGQGMSSLVHNESFGILLDAGAGKPVTRDRYLDKAKPFQNDLRTLIAPLSRLKMVASHTDYDHWKLLAWDPALLKKVETILVPDGTDHLLFKDQAVISKCIGIGSMTLSLNHNTSIALHRAKPSDMDSNGNCLVAVFDREGVQVLAPGDYVYSRFKSDGNPNIKSLLNNAYEAVIVPHHGDKESANDVVTPASESAKAFFSAGTHQGYKHPTVESLQAHTAAKFVRVSHCEKAFILKVHLL
ncbi:MAG: hypothetical protein Q8S92_16995 [Hydrogenophaga sp.]|uniref:hypothetical protein n=1 Tax=Hydrogenophaga sp. TaxID=1904254 RepID=UPI0027358853|nr:hypothetical protein [Hydrogenophaga sp.]MDP3350691.1 hypothetical protein [Hydrogenophaga sp.]